MKKIFTLCAICALFCAFNTQVLAYDLTVAKDGSGNYTTVQAAIDAAPTNATAAYTIFIKNGTYKEKITVASNKTFITLIGESVANVILTYDDYSGKPIPGGGGATYGTSNSASTTINATDFTAVNITFENTTGESPQALAINVNNDRCAFKNCRFLGGQDTLLANNSGKRQYYKQCYIDGTVDFIFGNAAAVFEDCTIYPKTRLSGTGSSFITAANTQAGVPYGYVFRNCTIQMNRGVTQYYLGRPWQNTTSSSPVAENKVVFLNTIQSGSIILPAGWSTWDATTNTSIITNAEYQSVTQTGAAVDVSSRVAWSQQLNATQAATYSNANIFTTWDPCTAYTNMCNSTPLDIAVSNFTGIKGASTAAFTWNASWGIDGVTYTVYRSINNKVSFQSLYSVTSAGIYDVNFGTTDANPPAGSTYYYYVVGSKAGFASHTTATVAISSTPTITVGTTGAFLQGLGTPSSAQYYALSAVNLTADLTITPPTNYQISIDGGTTWSSTPLSITPISNAIASRTIGVRLNSATVGTFSGNIVHTSAGAVDANVAVTGTVQADPLPTSIVLLNFPLTSSNADDVPSRAAGVTTTTPTLSRLTTSTGTSPAAYSTTFGQALCPIGTSNGLWSTSTANAGVSDGTGGNLSRTHYEQFTLTAASGFSVRVDSFTITSAFYNTSSNTKLAVVYSKTGFTTADSTDVTGGILGLTGAVLAGTANGAFATPILLSNQTAGTTINYRLALNSSTGVTLAAGQTLTVRIYFACGSTGIPRYAMVKDVYFKGLTNTTVPLSILDIDAEKVSANTNRVKWTTANEINVDRFDIERSSNGLDFEKIGETKAIGNTKVQYDYTFMDKQPLSSFNYYRLKTLDFDGSWTYSKVVTVENKEGNGLKVKLFPMPFADVLNIVIDNENIKTNNLSIRLMDVLGRTLWTQESNSQNISLSIPTNRLQNGTYFLKITDYNNTYLYKILK